MNNMNTTLTMENAKHADELARKIRPMLDNPTWDAKTLMTAWTFLSIIKGGAVVPLPTVQKVTKEVLADYDFDGFANYDFTSPADDNVTV